MNELAVVVVVVHHVVVGPSVCFLNPFRNDSSLLLLGSSEFVLEVADVGGPIVPGGGKKILYNLTAEFPIKNVNITDM